MFYAFSSLSHCYTQGCSNNDELQKTRPQLVACLKALKCDEHLIQHTCFHALLLTCVTMRENMLYKAKITWQSIYKVRKSQFLEKPR